MGIKPTTKIVYTFQGDEFKLISWAIERRNKELDRLERELKVTRDRLLAEAQLVHEALWDEVGWRTGLPVHDGDEYELKFDRKKDGVITLVEHGRREDDGSSEDLPATLRTLIEAFGGEMITVEL